MFGSFLAPRLYDFGDDDSSGGSTGSSSPKKNRSKSQNALSAAGSSLSQSGQDMMDRASSDRITPVSYKRGGKTRKTGLANLHKGERVIPKSKVKRVEKMMRKKKMRMKARS
jgi:hypothetical protein